MATRRPIVLVSGVISELPVGDSIAPLFSELPVSKLQDGAARQLLQTDAAGTGVEWTSNVDVPGTLDVTSAATFDDIASHPRGTAEAPTVTFTDDLNTGIYSPGADQLALSTSGTEALRINADGDILVADGNRMEIDEIRARDGAGLKLFDDAGAGIFVQDGGSVGIGTSAPGAKLEVVGTDLSGTYQTLVSADSPTAAIVNQSANTYFRIAGGLYGNASSVNLDLAPNRSKNKDIQGGWRFSSITGTPASSATGSNLQIKPITYTSSDTITEGGASLTITNTGAVGIGTTSPDAAAKLAVSNNGAEGLEVRAGYNSGASEFIAYNRSSSQYIDLRYDAGHHAFKIAGSEKARIDSSGRLLVGTSSYSSSRPNAAIYLDSTSATAGFGNISLGYNGTDASNQNVITFYRTRGTNAGDTTIVNNGDSLGSLNFNGADGVDVLSGAASIGAEVDGTPGANDMPGRLVFFTTADGASSPTPRLYIDNAGFIFPDTDSFNHRASVQGRPNGIKVVAASAPSISRYEGFATVTATAYHMDFSNPNGVVGSISTSSSSTSFNTSSDYRLKENVTPVTDGITRLQQLKPSRFNFIADPSTVVDGFLAHEVQDIVPEAITGEKDAVDDEGNPVYQGIDQSKLVPLLTAALQEAIAKIETLEQRLNDAGIN